MIDRIEVPAGAAGTRLDDFLEARLGWLSRIRIRAAIRSGECLVNGQAVDRGVRLTPGDVVAVRLAAGPPTAMMPEQIPLDILYEDPDLAVVVKPPGMLVHPTRSVKAGTLANALSGHWNPFLASAEEREESSCPVIRPGFVHRLDRLTSGLMVVAKHAPALRALSLAFAKRQVTKRYLAIVGGVFDPRLSEIEGPIGRVLDANPQWQVTPTGKSALTRVEVLAQKDSAALLSLEPVTGRTNQLRVHCAHAGHPILGDPVYGGPAAGRLCLHATLLRFRHPGCREWLEFQSPMPRDMVAIWESPGA